MTKKTIWTSTEAEKATGGKSTCKWKATGVSIDSRKIEPGDLFIAIPGEKFDGHDFVKDALKKGAAAAVVTRIPDGVSKDAPLLVVNYIMTALQDLGKFSRNRMRGKVIGVTGSVGKTSTKEMLALSFKGQGKVYFTEGNLNNHYGLPLSLARMPAKTDFGIFEIGMNHAGEISPLSKMARPDVAIITTVEAVHLEFFKSVEEIAHAKAEIFDGMGAQQGFEKSESKKCTAVLNYDNPYYKLLKERAKAAGIKKIVSFGDAKGADFRIKDYAEKNGKGRIVLDADGQKMEYKLGITGKHQAHNSAGVLAVVEAAGGDLEKATKNLAKFEAKPGRGKIYDINYKGKSVTIIDDCYNASPASVAAALDKLGNMKAAGRKIAVLGDMFELGDTAAQLHKDVSKKLVENHIDLLFTAGDLTLNLYKAIPEGMRGGNAPDSGTLGAILAKTLQTGDVLLVKGSRGMRMENVINFLQGK
jgi:UDP-N-acetylmuramoyl-tripeptide--D-alanyl-D-alanine ligase